MTLIFPETKVILDEKGHPLEIKAYERNTATDIIEDFMLLANETVAKEYHERNLPFLYRIHGEPDADKIENVLSLARTGQIKAEKKKQKITPGEVQKHSDSAGGSASGAYDQPSAAAFHAAGSLLYSG